MLASPRARGRRELLDALNVPVDGPVQLAYRVDGVPAKVSCRRAAVGGALSTTTVLAAIGVLGRAATVTAESAALTVVGVLMLLAVLYAVPIDRERRGICVTHGPENRYLSVRTLTGIRTLDLAQITRIEQRRRAVRVLDANGVSARVDSVYGRRAVRNAVEAWGVGGSPASAAAQRRMILLSARKRMLRPLRPRRRPREIWWDVSG